MEKPDQTLDVEGIFASSSKDIAAYCVSLDIDNELRVVRLAPNSRHSVGKRWADTRRREFFAGRWAAASAIKNLLGIPAVPARNDDRSPRWPEGIIGSITHDHHQAIAVVGNSSKVCRIGVDLESILSHSQSEVVKETTLTHQDEQYLGYMSDQRRMITVIFSAKETLFKALYPEAGEYFDFKDAELVDVRPSSVTLQLCKKVGSCFESGERFTVNYLIISESVLTWQIDFH